MQFRTAIPAPQYPFQINETDTVMLVGSCFSDNMGHYFDTHRFETCSNPFGVLFNPISIDRAVRFMLQPDLFDKVGHHPVMDLLLPHHRIRGHLEQIRPDVLGQGLPGPVTNDICSCHIG